MRPSLVVRQRSEDLERASLSTWATLAVETKGRDRHEEPDDLRTAFQQDRDRLLHCEAFRGLRDKSHTFLAYRDESGTLRHRMRLIHTLEVGQVARTIARGLRLNEDLVEAIATGHALGETAFASAGEAALVALVKPQFRPHEHALRIVEVLEHRGRGLNLTWEVRNGILHSGWAMPAGATPEAQTVRLANRIVGLTRDLDDAEHCGLATDTGIPKRVTATFGTTHSQRVAGFVNDVITTSADLPELRLSAAFDIAQNRLDELLVEAIANDSSVRAEWDRAVHCLSSLVVYHLENPSRLPPAHQGDDPLERRVLDYVASLGDAQALDAFAQRFLPSSR